MIYEIDIFLTDICNSWCVFCYSDSKTIPLQILSKKFRIRLDIEFLKDCIHALCMSLPKGAFLSFGFTGGEPTLVSIDACDAVISIIKDYFPESRITLSTNGLLIDDEYVSWIAERDVFLSISIEPFAKQSPMEIERKIDLVNSHLPDRHCFHFVLSRVTSFDFLLDFTNRYHVESLDFSIFIPVGRGKFFPFLMLFEDEIISFFTRFVESGLYKKTPSFSKLKESLDQTNYRERVYFNNIWGPCWNRYRLDCEGFLSNPDKCTNERVSIFEIKQIDVLKMKYRVSLLKKRFDAQCTSCDFLPMCQGGCILLDDFVPTYYKCRGMKKLLEFLKCLKLS